MLSILTPCQDKTMLAVLRNTQHEFAKEVHDRFEWEWLVEDSSGTVACLRKRLIEKAQGDRLLWWDADDWIRPGWVIKALQVDRRAVFPKRYVRADVINQRALLYAHGKPSMAGGMLETSLAYCVAYPEPKEGALDADALWWWHIDKLYPNHLAVETAPGAVDVVCTVHGKNITALVGWYNGPWEHVPCEALPHCMRVSSAFST